ncbi:shikimate kinase [Sinomicrobium weinanense]|uniref:Shikimate kinase n=1 Tax=Sinomicrobium weinanense TaxID=2842200 RepID=A0A926Q4I6_9FLAO|nr:shikimate kinase [Sinomicrobium weinanense]MBC9796930.1 shikimate kinase [Sinomicrobium weinanense]MBU3124932.1 shikimate kinase [Sinomicrobium weinanense]
MVIVLIGYMGSGKSAVGKVLAENLSCTFADMDDYIEEKEQKTIPEIFRDKGEIYFRKVESRYLQEILSGEKGAVISLGGGTPCYGDNMDRIKELADKVFYLKASVGELTARLGKEKDHRPLIKHLSDDELEEFIRKHLFERNFYYLRADSTVNVDGKTIEDIAGEIISGIK